MKKVIVIFFGTLIFIVAAYWFGFVYSFRNFGEQGQLNSLAAYKFNASKSKVESLINTIVLNDSPKLRFANKNIQFSNNDYFTLIVETNSIDSTEFIFRFSGDSSSWSKDSGSSIFLFSVADTYLNITSKNLKRIDPGVVKQKFDLFETVLIEPLKSKQ